MSAGKPTPGPWRTHHSGHPDSVTVIKGADNTIIADVYGYDAADARLIAAAPELLDALQVMLGHMTGGMDGDWRDCDYLALARAAIAKTGAA